ncbi:hypothetical protein [Streptomyces fractus]|uniref:hypothetical protein n=1 Tax=Streptomyces fractus TaxID=641806 RepID=UPI003CF7EF42
MRAQPRGDYCRALCIALNCPARTVGAISRAHSGSSLPGSVLPRSDQAVIIAW